MEVLEPEQQYSWNLYQATPSDIPDSINFVSPAELSGYDMQLNTDPELDSSTLLADLSILLEEACEVNFTND
jgi:hypothetical protein